MKMYKANSLATFLKDDMTFAWEADMFDSDEEETVANRKTCIRFDDNVDTREIPCIMEMHRSEIDSIWYSQEEFAVMKAECRELTKSIKSGRINISADICLRGLEEKLHRSQKKVNRSEAVGAVLDEQDAQFGYGEQNPERIAHVYHEFAAHCLDEAVAIGLRDQETAFRIHGLASCPRSSSPASKMCAPKPSGVPTLGGRKMLLA